MKSWKLKLFGLLTVLIILLIGAGIIRGKFSDSFTVNMSSQTVIKEIKELNRLETASFTIEKVIDAGTDGNRFSELLYGDRILLIAHGQVIAGFDLSKLADNSAEVDGRSLRLTLPSPEILITTLDNEQTRVFDRRLGLLTKGDRDLEAQARSEAQEVIRKAACQGKILDEASKNARNQLTALLKSFGYTTVIIEIPQGNC